MPDTAKLAKPDPDIVKETDPDLGALVFNELIFGEPYDTCNDSVALGVSTALETTASKKRPAPRATLQITPEFDCQVETKETLLPKTTLMLMEKEPMFIPTAVTELEPVAAIRCAPIEDIDGTSNESAFEILPERIPVETTASLLFMSMAREIFDDMEELEVQRTASAWEDDSADFGEQLVSPYADPTIVSDDAPEAGTLNTPSKAFMEGLSKEMRPKKDPC